jgi:hypothetical protein
MAITGAGAIAGASIARSDDEVDVHRAVFRYE